MRPPAVCHGGLLATDLSPRESAVSLVGRGTKSATDRRYTFPTVRLRIPSVGGEPGPSAQVEGIVGGWCGALKVRIAGFANSTVTTASGKM